MATTSADDPEYEILESELVSLEASMQSLQEEIEDQRSSSRATLAELRLTLRREKAQRIALEAELTRLQDEAEDIQASNRSNLLLMEQRVRSMERGTAKMYEKTSESIPRESELIDKLASLQRRIECEETIQETQQTEHQTREQDIQIWRDKLKGLEEKELELLILLADEEVLY
ncbi:hypothetical protein EIP91_011349, partial [Steccherinum ochraceum]